MSLEENFPTPENLDCIKRNLPETGEGTGPFLFL